MGTFPDRQHYFAAAGENRDIGSLWRGPFFIGRILFSRINKIQVWRRSDLTKKKLKNNLWGPRGVPQPGVPPKIGKLVNLRPSLRSEREL